MLLIPTVDLKEGRCVRLEQGLMEQATVFPGSSAETALHWPKQGARRPHLMDLNGAFVGILKNFPAIRSILAEVVNDIPVQLGDGIHDLATIEEYLGLGLADVITSTVAARDPDFVHEVCKEFPGQIIARPDVKDGMVAIDGRATVTEYCITDLAKRLGEDGVNAIIYTDIGRDGMMSGIDIEATVKLAQAAAALIVVSGGLTNLDDIHASCAVGKHGMAGAITDRTIYEDSIDSVEAQKLANALNAA